MLNKEQSLRSLRTVTANTVIGPKHLTKFRSFFESLNNGKLICASCSLDFMTSKFPHLHLLAKLQIYGVFTSSNQRCMGSAVSSSAVVFPILLFANGFCENKRYIDTR